MTRGRGLVGVGVALTAGAGLVGVVRVAIAISVGAMFLPHLSERRRPVGDLFDQRRDPLDGGGGLVRIGLVVAQLVDVRRAALGGVGDGIIGVGGHGDR